jgi:hypothetical protein
MKKLITLLSVVLLLALPIKVNALVDVTTGVASPSEWVNVVPASNAFDFLVDQQTGSGSVSQDLVGGTADFGSGLKDYGVFYIQFDDNGTVTTADDELAFRFRINNADGVKKDTFQYYLFVGLDFDLNGSVDLFTGIYNPDNNGSKSISIYESDPTKSNTSPSTTGFGDKLYETVPVKNDNWGIMVTDDGSLFSGDVDYFVTFKLPLSAFNSALVLADPTWEMTTSSPLRMFIGTASQANSYNQDMGGIDGLNTKSTVPWASMGVFMPIVNPLGQLVVINLAPSAQDDAHTFAHKGSVKFKLNASDPEDDTLIFPVITTESLSDPTCATISGPDLTGEYTYTDNGTCFGDNKITFAVMDGSENTSNTATITFTPINEKPVAEDQKFEFPQKGSVTFKLLASDPENESLGYPKTLILSDPTCGSLSGPDLDGNYSYTDNGTCTSSNTIEFTVTDGTNISEPATLTFSPIIIKAQDQTVILPKGGSVKIKLSATDSNGHPLTYTPSQPTCGTLNGPDENGEYTYTDNGTCKNGSISFIASYTANGETFSSEAATITITILDPLPNTGVQRDVSGLLLLGSLGLLFVSKKKKLG